MQDLKLRARRLRREIGIALALTFAAGAFLVTALDRKQDKTVSVVMPGAAPQGEAN
jgi:hypothetical protein